MAVALDGASLATADNATFVVTGLGAKTAAAGAYTLALTAGGSGVADAAGNPLSAGPVASWTTSAPVVPSKLTAVTPNPLAGSPFLQDLTFTGSDFPADATVKLKNLTTGASVSNATIRSLSATQLVVRAAVGTTASNWSGQVTGTGGSSGTLGFSVKAQAAATVTVSRPSTASKTVSLGVTGAVGANLTYAWSTASAPAAAPAVTFSVNNGPAAGTVATFARAGTYTLKVRTSDGLTAVDTSVALTVTQQLASISVTPAAVTLANGKTQQFAAGASDQFGQPMTTKPAVTWSLASGVGTVTGAGLYTSPAFGSGAATVRATSGSVSATASVTVQPAAPAFTSAKINFQPAAAPAVSGYLVDGGAVYAARSGQTYGWNVSHADAAVDRNKNTSQLTDTNVGVKAGGKWEIAVPNGTYSVRVSVGDSGAASVNTVRLEGSTVFNALSLAANAYGSRLVTVTVADGRLTLDAGSSANLTTRVNYVEITRVG